MSQLQHFLVQEVDQALCNDGTTFATLNQHWFNVLFLLGLPQSLPQARDVVPILFDCRGTVCDAGSWSIQTTLRRRLVFDGKDYKKRALFHDDREIGLVFYSPTHQTRDVGAMLFEYSCFGQRRSYEQYERGRPK